MPMRIRSRNQCCVGAFSLAIAAANALAATDRGWPRAFEKGEQRIVVYEPQVRDWDRFTTLQFACAISVTTGANKPPVFGIWEVTAKTKTDTTNGTVVLLEPKAEFRFQGEDAAAAAEAKGAAETLLPDLNATVVSLTRVLAYAEAAKSSLTAQVKVNLDAPPISYSDRPAVMVIFLGAPKFKPVPGLKLMFATNTNWDVFLDPTTSTYYMRDEESWLTTKDLEKGPWAPAGPNLPAELSMLPADENWDDVKKSLPGKPLASVPEVRVSRAPAELIVTEGEPQLAPVEGVPALMYVTNTESVLFKHVREDQFYLLLAGRWFRAKSPAGPWAPASTDLPADFAKIPDDGDAAEVLASVPGTEQAKDAALLASVPQTAVVERSQVNVNVAYQGTPNFVTIAPTQVQYATNTSSDVFYCAGMYYCCDRGVWFMSANAVGPWIVCDNVPVAIYGIPPTCPKYNVTYVRVYDSTPDTVTVGASAGYSGEFVAATGVVMFGAGLALGAILADDSDIYVHYGPAYYSYGCGARYSPAYGCYYRAGSVYGPYGGAGAFAAYNPATGGYARGAYRYGPSGGAFAREAYNPFSHTYAARAGGTLNGYGSWSRGVIANDDGWIAGGRRTGPGGTTGWIQTSNGKEIIGGRGPGGAAAIAGPNGNVFAGRDGNVYRRGDNGSWQREVGGRGGTEEGGLRRYQPSAPAGSPGRPDDTRDRLDRDAASRARGNRPSPNFTHRSLPSGGGRLGGGRFGGGFRRR